MEPASSAHQEHTRTSKETDAQMRQKHVGANNSRRIAFAENFQNQIGGSLTQNNCDQQLQLINICSKSQSAALVLTSREI